MSELLRGVYDAVGLDYLAWKYIHIISATLLFGTGLGTAFHMYSSHLSGDPRAIAVAARNTVIADWTFTTPAVVVQPLSGLMLAVAIGADVTGGWVLASLLLYVFVGCCWLPVVWLQMRARRLAEHAVATGSPLPATYFRVMRVWFLLGWPAFFGVLIIFYMMLYKALPI
ncbi:MAG: DUF2269 domain-containing protein [Rhodospirillaceae bacterium]|nr:DUF2269 domain-containing protein [Rhodospirillaceae bacterium]